MWDVNSLQVGSVVLRYAEEVQLISLLIIADLEQSATPRVENILKGVSMTSCVLSGTLMEP